MAESDPALTVAICTRNRRALVLRALASLAAQSARVRWSVLVVDNASEDDTGAAVAAIADDFPVPLAVEREPVRGLSAARNRALAVTTARAIVFLDDDATCRAGWVDAHARALSAPDVVATGGPVLPVLPDALPEPWRAFLAHELGGPTSHYDCGPDPQDCGAQGAPLPFGANLGLVRATALGTGGFRTDLGWGARMIPGEETELLMRLARRRGRIRYLPDAVIDHHIEPERASLAYYLRWYRGLGRSLARLDPPVNAGQRARRAATQLARAARWSVSGRHPHSLRERERALGHALELLRFD